MPLDGTLVPRPVERVRRRRGGRFGSAYDIAPPTLSVHSFSLEACVNETLSIDVSREPAGTMVVVAGELDADNCHQLKAAAADLDGTVRLDLSGLDFVDSSGVGTIVKIKEQVDSQGGNLTVSATSPSVRKVLDITGLTSFLSPEG